MSVTERDFFSLHLFAVEQMLSCPDRGHAKVREGRRFDHGPVRAAVHKDDEPDKVARLS